MMPFLLDCRKVLNASCTLYLLCIHTYSCTSKFNNKLTPQNPLNVISLIVTELKAARQLSGVILSGLGFCTVYPHLTLYFGLHHFCALLLKSP